MAKKILIVTGDAGESYEAWYAYHRFLEAEWEPVVAAPSKRWLHLVMHDFEPGWDTYVERPGYRMQSHVSFDDVNVEEYEAVVLLGGRAPEYLRHNETLLDVVRAFRDQDKWIFSICHGIQILIAAGLAPGVELTAYEHLRYEIESGGGRYSTLEAVRDGKIVSGQTWQSHPDFYREVFACLGAAREEAVIL
jgi:protease I